MASYWNNKIILGDRIVAHNPLVVILFSFSRTFLYITEFTSVIRDKSEQHDRHRTPLTTYWLVHCHIKWENAKKEEEEKKTVLFAYNRVEDIAYARTTESDRCIVKQNVIQHPHNDIVVHVQETEYPILYGTKPNRKQLDFTPRKSELNSCCEQQLASHDGKICCFIRFVKTKEQQTEPAKRGEIVLISKPKPKSSSSSSSYPLDGNTNSLIRWKPAHTLAESFLQSVRIGAMVSQGIFNHFEFMGKLGKQYPIELAKREINFSDLLQNFQILNSVVPIHLHLFKNWINLTEPATNIGWSVCAFRRRFSSEQLGE